MRFTAAIRKEGDGYVAQCLEVEVAVEGESVEASLENLRQALEVHFEEHAPPSSPPSPPIIASLEVSVRPKRSGFLSRWRARATSSN